MRSQAARLHADDGKTTTNRRHLARRLAVGDAMTEEDLASMAETGRTASVTAIQTDLGNELIGLHA